MKKLTAELKEYARSIGFARIGITDATAPSDFPHYLAWINKGYAGEMGYLTEETRVAKRGDLKKILPGAQSVIVTAVSYAPRTPTHSTDAKFARYAWGQDYHPVVKKKLDELVEWLRKFYPEPFEARTYVDTGPILERSLAQRAGIGWIGKNSCVLNESDGSYIFLGEIIITLPLPSDSPALNHCGSCTRCLDACPTNALVTPYELDARKCISYQTIEQRKEEIPESIALKLNGWVAGCDICQEVCPWNREPENYALEEFKPLPYVSMSLDEARSISREEFSKQFKKSALKRIGWNAFVRNANVGITALTRVANETR